MAPKPQPIDTAVDQTTAAQPTDTAVDQPTAAQPTTTDAATVVEAPVADQAAGTTGTELMVVDFGDDEGKGAENIKADEFAIPFLRSVHYMAPQVKPTEPKYIKGATPGMLLKTSTSELFDGLEVGLDFLPVHRDHQYVEFTPRASGGGFVGIRAIEDPLVVALKKSQGKFGKLVTNTGTELTEVFNIYGLFIAPSGYSFPAILSFSSTQIKKYQAFMEIQAGLKQVYPNAPGSAKPFKEPPLWAHKWHLVTRPEKNSKGDYFGYVLTMVNGATLQTSRLALVKPNDPLYIRARELNEAIEAGRVTADHEGDAAAGGGGKTDDDIPF